MTKLKAFLIDDELAALETLRWEIEQHCPSLDIVGTHTNSVEAIPMIYSAKPDVIFLDIEMPRLNGFDFLAALPEHQSKVIFTTAYDQFALKAIKVQAFDYLLKPIDSEELIAAVKRVHEQMTVSHFISNNLGGDSGLNRKITLPNQTGFDLVDQKEIYYCESSGNYTNIYTKSEHYFVSKTLKHIEAQLDNRLFLRIHHSFIINLNQVIKYLKGEGGEVVLSNGVHLRVSRSRKEEVVNRLQKSNLI